MTVGNIRGLGRRLKEGLDAMEIWVIKNHANELPYRYNLRIPITLIIEDKKYNAGLRSTRNNEYVWICPDLRDDADNRISLARALTSHGFQKKPKNIPEC